MKIFLGFSEEEEEDEGGERKMYVFGKNLYGEFLLFPYSIS